MTRDFQKTLQHEDFTYTKDLCTTVQWMETLLLTLEHLEISKTRWLYIGCQARSVYSFHHTCTRTYSCPMPGTICIYYWVLRTWIHSLSLTVTHSLTSSLAHARASKFLSYFCTITVRQLITLCNFTLHLKKHCVIACLLTITYHHPRGYYYLVEFQFQKGKQFSLLTSTKMEEVDIL